MNLYAASAVIISLPILHNGKEVATKLEY